VADDRVAAAVAELYGADPDAFTERRKVLVVAAREAGDKRSAAAITALRKPTRAAWVVNRLARADPDAPARLAAMAAELRDAERAKDGPRLRELSAARGALIDALTARALAAAGVFDPPSSLRDEVTATLTAALADPATAAGFAAGSLTKAAQWSGFGYAADLGPADDASSSQPRPRAAPRLTVVPGPTRRAERTDRAKRSRADASPSAQAAAQRARQEQQRLAAAEQRRAQEAAERAARVREKYEDAERTLAQASAADAEAAAVEDQLEAEVRQLEERLTQAREELATARLRARRAEAAERRARQVLDRLPPP
jgi:flagellar biosynthesis GTPase FlhF